MQVENCEKEQASTTEIRKWHLISVTSLHSFSTTSDKLKLRESLSWVLLGKIAEAYVQRDHSCSNEKGNDRKKRIRHELPKSLGNSWTMRMAQILNNPAKGKTVVFNQGWFGLPRTCGRIWKHRELSGPARGGSMKVEAGNPNKQPTMHRTELHKEQLPSSQVNNVKVWENLACP